MEPKKRRFLDKLRNRYRLVVLDDETFEERASFRLTRFNVYVLLSVVFVVGVAGIFSLIVFTPLKEYIPGYGEVNLRKNLIEMKLKADSLHEVVAQQEMWIQNIQNVLQGNIDTASQQTEQRPLKYDSITLNLEGLPEEDLRLREEIEREQSYALSFSGKKRKSELALSQINFFPPLKGYITSGFNPAEEHFGIDIVAPGEEPVKNILDGRVVLASWTLETGYVIGIQHEYNLISFYKHNSVLLKKVGNFVKAGDAIAVEGNSGELTTGPHLHFELWHEGVPVNPEDYIIF
ncbi:MAG TPA: M23 family metallopeptidase [Chitinophagales bacterium]|nr:M23 family metallopeptidase [Chitinophagales bacterium]